jgi:hypothetical protein
VWFKSGEPTALCQQTLAEGPKSTRQLALYIQGQSARPRGVLSSPIGFPLTQALK